MAKRISAVEAPKLQLKSVCVLKSSNKYKKRTARRERESECIRVFIECSHVDLKKKAVKLKFSTCNRATTKYREKKKIEK